MTYDAEKLPKFPERIYLYPRRSGGGYVTQTISSEWAEEMGGDTLAVGYIRVSIFAAQGERIIQLENDLAAKDAEIAKLRDELEVYKIENAAIKHYVAPGPKASAQRLVVTLPQKLKSNRLSTEYIAGYNDAIDDSADYIRAAGGDVREGK